MRAVASLCLALIALVFSASADPQAESNDPPVVWTFNAEPLRSLDLRNSTSAREVWDTMHGLAALQGLANRLSPQLYVLYCREFGVETDRFWLDWFRGEDGWLKAVEVRTLPDLEAVVTQFRSSFEGVVVYDGNVPATAAVASTAAGVEKLLPVRYDTAANSLYSRLVLQRGLPVKLWLVHEDGSPLFTGREVIPDLALPSSGSAKIDAYRWAMERYLKPGRCGVGVAAYYVDAFWLTRPTQGGPDMHTLSNHDWFIARRAFFFDLSPWGDEMPVDDPTQRLGADKQCLLNVLGVLYRNAEGGIVRIGGSRRGLLSTPRTAMSAGMRAFPRSGSSRA